ncbi:MAG: DMT family transporter, partial [Victivallaceae bacterium]|nr:DMT family transporter [Victivallaceae bacterium]
MFPFAPFAAPILLSALCLGFYDIAKKSSVNGNSVMPVLFFSSLTGTAVFVAALFFAGKLPEAVGCSAKEGAGYAVKVLLVGTSWICTYYALRELPITIAAPIRASSPLWTLLGGIALYGETPDRVRLLGMGLIFAGYAIFTVVGKKEGFRPTGRAMVLVTAGTLLGSASALFDECLLGVWMCPQLAVQLYFSVGITVFLG